MADADLGEEQTLREMAWYLLVRRDHLLRLAEGLPAGDRERVRRIAGDLEVFFNRLRALADDLSSYTDPGNPQESKPSAADLRHRIRRVMNDLFLTGKALYEIAGPPPEGEKKAVEQAN
jgi:hypothetical protein